MTGGEFSTVADVQRVLDQFGYKANWQEDYVVESVSALIHRSELMCLDGAMLALGLLEGLRDLDLSLLAIHRRDEEGFECGHVAAVYGLKGRYGTIAVSNFPGLRSQEAIYRSAHHIAMHYAQEYVRIGFRPLLYSISKIDEIFEGEAWRTASQPLCGVVERIVETYRYQFVLNPGKGGEAVCR